MAMYQAAKGVDALTFSNTLMQLQGVARAIVEWTAQYDAVLCPSLAEPPVPLGTIDTCDEDDPMAGFWRAADFTPFTPVSNLTGSPAISVPLLHDDELGLPVGVADHRPARGRGRAARAVRAARGGAPVGRAPRAGRGRPGLAVAGPGTAPDARPPSARRQPRHAGAQPGAQHLGHPPRLDAELAGVGRAARRRQRDLEQLRLVPRDRRPAAEQRLADLQRARGRPAPGT